MPFPPLPSYRAAGREVKRSRGGRIVAFHRAIDGAVFPGSDRIRPCASQAPRTAATVRRGIMLQRDQHHIGLFAKMADADLREGSSDILVDLPVALCLPSRVDGGERVDKRACPRCSYRLFHTRWSAGTISEKTGTGHAKSSVTGRSSLPQSPLSTRLPQVYLIAGAQFITLNTAVGPEQVFQHVLIPYRTIPAGLSAR